MTLSHLVSSVSSILYVAMVIDQKRPLMFKELIHILGERRKFLLSLKDQAKFTEYEKYLKGLKDI